MAPVAFSGAVEGIVDEAVLVRLIQHVEANPGPIYGRTGKPQLRRAISGYNSAARRTPWVVLVDLNHQADCAPELLADWLPQPSSLMSLRVVVREIEAWLLGDIDRVAAALDVNPSRMPANPEDLDDPKRAMVELARSSRRRDIREDMVPRSASGRTVGPAYASRLVEFVADTSHGWRPDIASRRCPSLARCLRRLQQVVDDLS